MEKTIQKAKVIKVKNTDFEGRVWLSLEDRYKASHRITVEFFTRGESEKSIFVDGEVCDVIINGVGGSRGKKLIQHKMGLMDIREKKHYFNEYSVSGKILEMSKHPTHPNSYSVTLDCGFLLNTEIDFGLNPKAGDYFELKLRLDAHKAEKNEVKE